MSVATLLTGQKTKNGVFSFLNNFSLNKLVSQKEPTKDENWSKHSKEYKKLTSNLNLYSLTGNLFSTGEQNSIDFNTLVSGSIVQNPDVAYLTCMDEGVQYISVNKNVIPIAIPGCGVLMSKNQDDLRNKILETLQKFNIKKLVVDAHAKCGAANIAAKNEFSNLSCIHSSEFMEKLSELVADDYAHLLANNLHEDFEDLEVTSNYITKLERPDYHNAMGILVNFEANLNSSLLIQKLRIPLFALSAFVLDNDELAEDDILAYKIATGSHGFGERFDSKNPFLIIFTVKTEEQRKQALKMVSKIEATNYIKYTFIDIA